MLLEEEMTFELPVLNADYIFSFQSPSCALLSSTLPVPFGALASQGRGDPPQRPSHQGSGWALSVFLAAANLGLKMKVQIRNSDPSVQLLRVNSGLLFSQGFICPGCNSVLLQKINMTDLFVHLQIFIPS